MKYHELSPDAGRVITSLRDSGYNFNTAVADVVDNSISAGASFVRIAATCDEQAGDTVVAISDNGCGMDIEGLCNALTYGSSRREDEHSLGKFGLGLKTASTSQCRCLTVVSRKDEEVAKLTLDVDHAEATGRWEYIEDVPTRRELRYLDWAAEGGSGTVVLWAKCDRIMGRSYKNPGGKAQQNALRRKVDGLRFHLGMVFQRFLDSGDKRAANVRIVLNGDEVKPFDPFAKDLGLSEVTYDASAAFGWEGEPDAVSLVHVAAHVVPSRDELVENADIEKVFPPKENPDSMQGIYVYRENRLIHWGDWCGLYKNEFHSRLCRVELSFDASLDDCFSVDFQKSKISLDESVAEWLRESILPRVRKRGQERYRGGKVETEVKQAPVAHAHSNKAICKMEENDDGRLFEVKGIGDGKRRVSSVKGRRFVEAIPAASYAKTKENIRIVESLPHGALWRAGVFDDAGVTRTYVEINAGHAFYEYARYVGKGQGNVIRCLDYLIWSLAQAEYATKDQDSRENYEDMIAEVSRTLRLLALDLPKDES